MATGTFDFNEFLSESGNTILNPKSYFSSFPTSGGITEPLIKGVIYGTLTAIIYLIWDLFNIADNGVFLFGYYGFTGFIRLVVSSVIGLFVWALALMVFSNISKGNTGFEASFRIAAATMVIMPVNAFFGFLMFSPTLYILVSLLIFAIGLWILYNGMVHALKCQPAVVKTICYVIAVVLVILSLVSLTTRNKMERIVDQVKKEASE